MISIRRILRDHRETGSLASLMTLWGFIDERTFLTKAGAVGVVFQLAGVDDECLDHDQRRAVTARFEQALRQLDESFRVYQYLLKDVAKPPPERRHSHPIVNDALGQRTAQFAANFSSKFPA